MKEKKTRLAAILLIFSIGYLLILARLFYWQVVKADTLKEVGEAQSTQSLDIPSIRGEILSNDGFPLATNKITYLLYANPKIIDEKLKLARLLAPALEVEESSISARLDNELFWVRLASGLNEKEKKKIEDLKLEGLGFQQESTRFYPEASMSAHLVGFVGKNDEGQDQGYFGVEGFYDTQLKGRDGRLYLVKDALGNAVINDIREEEKIDGRKIQLTIDRSVQFFAEKRLKDGVEKYEAQGGNIIVMNPKTGAIIAMASYPQFDPQTYYKFPTDTYKNPVVSSVFEPGSTFKVLIMAAAVDKGLVTPTTKCSICSGPVQIGEYSIKTWNNQYHPNTTMTDVIKNSDNTGMVFISRKLGLEGLLEYLRKFGFGEKTGIDVQGEVPSAVREEDSWYEIDTATAAFGQGISVTPIQLVTAVASIANGGKLVTPYVVEKIVTEDNNTIEINPKPKSRVISEKTAKTVTFMMENAVKEGDSKWVSLPGHRVAGKTGTAQIPVAGKYDPEQTVASFVGFYPVDEPQVITLVTIDRPKTSIYGSETAAPIFFQLARDITNYYQIPPTDY